jgi:predicted DNA-binding ribbon-helix-helix protein
MKSLVVKRSIVIDGYKTSVSLEEAFWNSLKEIARARNESAAQLIAHIDANRQFANLSSAIRLFVLEFCREQFSSQRGIVARDSSDAKSGPAWRRIVKDQG